MESQESTTRQESWDNPVLLDREITQSSLLSRVGCLATSGARVVMNRLGAPILTASLLAGSMSFHDSADTSHQTHAQGEVVTATEQAPTIGAPFYGPSTLGHTYRSAQLRPTAHSYDEMVAYYGDAYYHPYPAIDFKLPRGRAIRAVTDGVIAISSQETDSDPDAWPRRPGRFILLDPDDPLLPLFAFKHLDGSRVSAGQRVETGQIIGRAGSTQSPNVHLHFDAHNSVEGFNTYPEQADYGRIRFWQCGRLITLNTDTARMDRRINPQPSRAASIRNCNL